jgi:hypothetical protein
LYQFPLASRSLQAGLPLSAKLLLAGVLSAAAVVMA